MKARKLDLTYGRGLFYGPPGSGKTTLLGSGLSDSRFTPVLWLNCGGNPESIRKHPDVSNATFIEIEDLKDLDAIYEWVSLGQKMDAPFVKTCLKNGIDLAVFGVPYKSIVLDQITQLQRMLCASIAGWISKKIGDKLPPMQIQHWGEALNILVWASNLYFSLPLHVWFTAQERLEKDGANDSLLEYGPQLWGQGRVEVPSYALLVGRVVRRERMGAMVKKDNKIEPDVYGAVYFQYIERSQCKDQYTGFPAVMVDPNMTKILDIIDLSKLPAPAAG